MFACGNYIISGGFLEAVFIYPDLPLDLSGNLFLGFGGPSSVPFRNQFQGSGRDPTVPDGLLLRYTFPWTSPMLLWFHSSGNLHRFRLADSPVWGLAPFESCRYFRSSERIDVLSEAFWSLCVYFQFDFHLGVEHFLVRLNKAVLLADGSHIFDARSPSSWYQDEIYLVSGDPIVFASFASRFLDTTRLLLIAKLMDRSPLLFRSPMANLPMFADSEDSLSPIFALNSPATIITSFFGNATHQLWEFLKEHIPDVICFVFSWGITADNWQRGWLCLDTDVAEARSHGNPFHEVGG